MNQQLTNSNIDLEKQGPSSDGLYLGPPLNISLVTDLGIVLQTIFDRYTEKENYIIDLQEIFNVRVYAL